MPEFVYPYNFVEPGRPSERKAAPSQARFHGISGTLHCKLVTHTPIFTPDPDTNTAGRSGKEHRVLRFFRYEGLEGDLKYMIPGPSLKGMVRSVAEALTNSCFSQFDGGRVAPERPPPRAWNPPHPKRRAGRVVDREGQLWIEEMEEAYLPKHYAEQGTVKHGDEVWVQRSHDKTYGWVCGEPTLTNPGNGDWRHGYVRVNEKPTLGRPAARHYQRVFVDLEDRATACDVLVDKDIQQLWIEGTTDPGATQDERNKARLKLGDLLFYARDDSGSVTLGPAAVYKLPWKYTRKDVLERTHSHFLPCTDARCLCFCCRLFGFVRDEGDRPGEHPDPNGALGGRVSFGFARAMKAEKLEIKPLRTLGTPKPKFDPFYLQQSQAPQATTTWNDDAAKVRGRKFYWHHQDHSEEANYYQAPAAEGASHLNATITALKAGAEFTFDVDFWDLSKEELGCLLAALTLWNGAKHKFGMGKPVGLGSCTVHVTRLTIAKRLQRYRHGNLFGHADLKEREVKAHYAKPDNPLAPMLDFVVAAGRGPKYNPDPDVRYARTGFAYFASHKTDRLRTPAEVRTGKGQPEVAPPRPTPESRPRRGPRGAERG